MALIVVHGSRPVALGEEECVGLGKAGRFSPGLEGICQWLGDRSWSDLGDLPRGYHEGTEPHLRKSIVSAVKQTPSNTKAMTSKDLNQSIEVTLMFGS